MNIVVVVGLFITFLVLIEIGYFVLKKAWNPEKKAVHRRMNMLSAPWDQNESIDIRRKTLYSDIHWLNQILSKLPRLTRIKQLLEQSGLQHRLSVFVLSSALLAILGIVCGRLVTSKLLFLLPGAALLGTLPFLYIYHKKEKRMRRFQAQLPEALDLLARSLKAGHAFTGGLRMVADEFDDPIGVEFNKTLNEINFGVGLPEAMNNLTQRVDCLDLNFFVTSVIIQRETGGNLAEILENIAYLIRERFKLFGKIKILAAEGKLSAIILIVLPFFVGFVIFMLNPEYMETLITDPFGRILLGIAVGMMAVGIFVMRKIIMIKV